MDFLRKSGSNSVELQTLRGGYPENRSEIEVHADDIIEDSDVIYESGDGTINFVSEIPHIPLVSTCLLRHISFLAIAVSIVLEPMFPGPGTTDGVHRETRGGAGDPLRIFQL